MIKIILFIIFFASQAMAQVPESAPDPTITEKDLPDLKEKLEKVSDAVAKISNGGDVSGTKSRLLDGISAFSAIAKAPSLMFEADQTNNVDKAVESLKSNQVYTPDGVTPTDTAAEDKKKNNDAAKEEEKKVQESEKSYIYLASIIYTSPNDWAVWINKQKFTPKANPKDGELYLKRVDNDRVAILWTLSMSKWRIISGQKSDAIAPKVNDKNQVEIDFELRPNQTFILSQNAVVEGRAVINLSNQRKEKERRVAEAASKSKLVKK